MARSPCSRPPRHRAGEAGRFPGAGRAGRPGRPDGSATVELAAAIPLLVAITLAMVGVIGVARDQVLAQGAAREGARQAAIGAGGAGAVAAARAALPPGRPARVAVTPGPPGRVSVSVALPARLPFGVPLVTVRASAVAAVEPGPPPSTGGP
ncbi:MAG TPA: TadE family protein [Actinomycetes bacterium]|nr:TadE family protein [Actinomycetes bacterium]